MTDKNMTVEEALRRVLTEYGTGILNNPNRLLAILCDYAPAQRREIKLIVNALREGVSGILLKAVNQSGEEQHRSIMRCEQLLVENLYVSEPAAHMAVDTICFALGMKNTVSKPEEPESADAQYELAESYYYGNGDVEQNYKQAFFWYKKAAEQGHPHAQYNLGLRYKHGRGVKQNYKQAVSWYRKAAEQGHPHAQYELGLCYGYGRGVTRDDSQAIYWYNEAWKNPQADASIKGLAESAVRALKAKQKANTPNATSTAGEPRSADEQYELAVRYFYGSGNVKQSYGLALFWYKRAAEQGHPKAQFNLGTHYENGAGITRDCQMAVFWYQKAAKQGYPSAQYRLGECYTNGIGVSRDDSQAIYWYNEAWKNPQADASLKVLAASAVRVLEAKQKKKKWWQFFR